MAENEELDDETKIQDNEIVSDSEKVVVSESFKKIAQANQKRFVGDTKKTSPMVSDIMTQIDTMIIGQEEAKEELAGILTNTLAYDPYDKTPLAVLFFPGPTGVGKTEIVRSLAKIIYGDELFDLGMSKIDCNSFTESHEVAQLKGAPAGYKGYGDKPLLHPDFVFKHTNDALKKNTLHPIFKNIIERDRINLPSIILLDEFEKAHPNFITFFMNIFDEGIAILKDGTEVNFRNTIFIMTSNVGAEDIKQKLDGKGVMGFTLDNETDVDLFSKDYYKEVIQKSSLFKTEVLARLGIIPFRPLTDVEFYKRLNLQTELHNKAFDYTKIKLELTNSAQAHLVKESMKTHEGARSLVKMFKHDIKTSFTRLYKNGEVDRVEEITGHPVKIIEIDFKDDKYVEYLLVDENKKARNKELKKLALLNEKKKNLEQQEAIISLKEGSMLVTQRDVILPALKYYVALLTHREKLDINFEEELKSTEKVLSSFAYKQKDFDMLRYQILEDRYNEYEESYNDLHIFGNAVQLWNDDDKKHAFNGLIRYVEKYMRNYFDTNKDVKAIIKEGAGTTRDIIQPIVEYSMKLINRELSDNEIGIILAVLHREYSKLNSTIPVSKQIPHKKKEEVKKEEAKSVKEEKITTVEKQIVVNINFLNNFNETTTRDRLKNLFQEKFPEVILAITQNISNKKDSDDIIDIMNNIKVELEQQFALDSTKTTSIMKVVQDLLKEEELLKK